MKHSGLLLISCIFSQTEISFINLNFALNDIMDKDLSESKERKCIACVYLPKKVIIKFPFNLTQTKQSVKK